MAARYAGVLPYAYDHDQVLCVLLGQERHAPGQSGSDRWSDFGGLTDAGETLIDAAARECFEESMGIFGTVDQIRRRLHDDFSFATHGPRGGRHYLLHVAFDQHLPSYFSGFYHYARSSAALHNITLADDESGLFEKQAIAWVPVHRLLHDASSNRLPLRRFFDSDIEHCIRTGHLTRLIEAAENGARARRLQQRWPSAQR